MFDDMVKRLERIAMWGLGAIFVGVGGCVLLAWLGGCAGAEARLGTVDHNRLTATAEVDSLVKLVDEFQASVARFETGDVAIGGQGDSVTSWIREVVWGALWVVAILYYPAIHRPVRKWGERLVDGEGSNVKTSKRQNGGGEEHRLETGATVTTGAGADDGNGRANG